MEQGFLQILCPELEDGGKFPLAYTGRGRNVSPEFALKNLSSSVKTLAITLEDCSHPIKNFTHWVIWNIPAAAAVPGEIPAGKFLPALGGAVQGTAYGLHRYAGPKPPRGKSHTYCFTVYALDCALGQKAFWSKRKLLREMEGHILQQGKIFGWFG